jgi:hypothetical protein
MFAKSNALPKAIMCRDCVRKPWSKETGKLRSYPGAWRTFCSHRKNRVNNLKDKPSACSVCPSLDGGLVVKRARLLLHPIKQTARHNVRAIPNQATGSGERDLVWLVMDLVLDRWFDAFAVPCNPSFESLASRGPFSVSAYEPPFRNREDGRRPEHAPITLAYSRPEGHALPRHAEREAASSGERSSDRVAPLKRKTSGHHSGRRQAPNLPQTYPAEILGRLARH